MAQTETMTTMMAASQQVLVERMAGRGDVSAPCTHPPWAQPALFETAVFIGTMNPKHNTFSLTTAPEHAHAAQQATLLDPLHVHTLTAFLSARLHAALRAITPHRQ